MHNTCSKEDIIKYVDDAEEFAKLPNGPVKEAVKELKTLKTSSNGQYDQFLDDFENGVDLSKLGSGGVKAWEVAINSPIKTDVSWLTRIDNWLADGADAAKVSKLADEVGINPNLKSAFEADQVNYSSWQRIEDGTPTFKTNNPTGYLTCMKKMTLYDNTVGGSGTVKYYRVQTDHPNDQLLSVESNGNLTFNDKSSELYFSTDNMDHAIYYTTGQGVNINGTPFNVNPPPRPDGYIIEFEVPKWLDDQLKAASIPQSKAGSNPLNNNSPQIVDYVQPGNPFGIKESWQTQIESNYIQGSAKIVD